MQSATLASMARAPSARTLTVDRYFELLSVVEKTGCSALTKEDLRGFLKMQNEVVELAVRVDRDKALMLPNR